MFSIESFEIINWLGLSHQKTKLLKKPWTLLTHMFFHKDFIHLLFNLIGMYFGGKIFLKYLNGKQLASTYLLGGFSGAIFYILSYNYLPAFDTTQSAIAFGASASVLAIITAISTYIPTYQNTIPLIGRIELKYIAISFILIDICLIPESNSGGHIAHLGGAFYGFYFAQKLKKGKDISKGFNNTLDAIANYFKDETKLKTVHRRANTDEQWKEQTNREKKDINLILDKISKSGYESLNKKEKDILFKASKK